MTDLVLHKAMLSPLTDTFTSKGLFQGDNVEI